MQVSDIYVAVRDRISPDLTSSGYSDAKILRAVNRWYRRAFSWVVAEMGTWEQNGNILSEDLQPDVAGYEFDLSSIVAINNVEVNYNPNRSDTFVKATVLDDLEAQGALQNGTVLGASEAAPRFRLHGNIIYVYPTSPVLVPNGLVVEIVDDLTNMAAADDVPNLNPLIHEVLIAGAALQYAISIKSRVLIAELKDEIFGRGPEDGESLQYALRDLARNLNRDQRQRIQPRRQRFN